MVPPALEMAFVLPFGRETVGFLPGTSPIAAGKEVLVFEIVIVNFWQVIVALLSSFPEVGADRNVRIVLAWKILVSFIIFYQRLNSVPSVPF